MADTHKMTISMGNLCGTPATGPDGRQATSDPERVTCQACLEVMTAADAP